MKWKVWRFILWKISVMKKTYTPPNGKHNVWKLLKMSHLNFSISTNFVLLKVTYLVTLFDRKLQVFKNWPFLTFLTIFVHFGFTHYTFWVVVSFFKTHIVSCQNIGWIKSFVIHRTVQPLCFNQNRLKRSILLYITFQ